MGSDRITPVAVSMFALCVEDDRSGVGWVGYRFYFRTHVPVLILVQLLYLLHHNNIFVLSMTMSPRQGMIQRLEWPWRSL